MVSVLGYVKPSDFLLFVIEFTNHDRKVMIVYDGLA